MAAYASSDSLSMHWGKPKIWRASAHAAASRSQSKEAYKQEASSIQHHFSDDNDAPDESSLRCNSVPFRSVPLHGALEHVLRISAHASDEKVRRHADIWHRSASFATSYCHWRSRVPFQNRVHSASCGSKPLQALLNRRFRLGQLLASRIKFKARCSSPLVVTQGS